MIENLFKPTETNFLDILGIPSLTPEIENALLKLAFLQIDLRSKEEEINIVRDNIHLKTEEIMRLLEQAKAEYQKSLPLKEDARVIYPRSSLKQE